MHATLTAVWRYLRGEYEALQNGRVYGAEGQSLQCRVSESTLQSCRVWAEWQSLGRVAESGQTAWGHGKADDSPTGIESGFLHADRDLKLEYMFRVLKHLGSSRTLLA